MSVLTFESFVPSIDENIKFGAKLYTRNFDSINKNLRD